MFCSNCGKDIGDAKFCPECGTPAASTVKETQEPIPVMPPNTPEPQKRKKKPGCLIVVLVVVVLSLIMMPFMTSETAGYSSVDNAQKREDRREEVASFVNDFLVDSGYYPASFNVDWIGYSHFEDIYSEEEFEESQLGGYYSVSGDLIGGSTYSGRVYSYWEEDSEPVILDMEILTDKLTEIQETDLIVYSDETIERCWQEYQFRAGKTESAPENSPFVSDNNSSSITRNEAALTDSQRQTIEISLSALGVESDWIEDGPAITADNFGGIAGLDEIISNMKQYYIHTADGGLYTLFYDTQYGKVVMVSQVSASGEVEILLNDIESLIDLYYPPVASYAPAEPPASSSYTQPNYFEEDIKYFHDISED